jgi:HK97 family phage portal protein
MIDTEKALGLSVVYACVNRISSTIAHLNLAIYAKEGANKIKATAHPAYELITQQPEEGFTAFDFWQLFVANILIYGKAYAIIRKMPNGDPFELCVVHPDRVEVKEVEGEAVYLVKDDGSYMAEEMLVVRNLYGRSPIELHRDMLGLAKAAQDFASEFYGSSGNMTGILSSTEPLTKEQLDIIKDSWNNSGDNLGTKLLPFGFKYERIGVAPESAQMSQQLDYLNQEICRIFGVPPAIVGVASNQTYSNTEQQAIAFAKHCIVPLCAKLEQEMNIKLIASDERDRLYTKFDLSDMLRGDSSSRADYYDKLLKAGVMTINEVRALENLDPVPNGSLNLVQINQIALSEIDEYSKKVSSDSIAN